MTEQSFRGRTSTGDVEIGTPDVVYLPLHREFNFTFDLAATPQNTKCARFFTQEDNALVQPWPRGIDVWSWLNPPYSRSVWRWVDKAVEEAALGANIGMLLNANVEQEWFQDVASQRAQIIRFLRFRVPFIKNGVQQKGGYHPSVFMTFRDPAIYPVPVRTVLRDGRFGYVEI